MQIRLSGRTLLCIVLILTIGSCVREEPARISLSAFVGGEPLEFGKEYPSPNGDGTFSITDFKFFLTNVKLMSGDGELYREPDSYHLVKFDNDNTCFISLDSIDLSSYDKVEMSIGIDEEANLSTRIAGDLDPTGQMAWNWTAGYKFVLLEGLYRPESSNRSVPLVFHIGFSENRKDLEFPTNSSGQISLAVEINELFTSPNPIDFHKKSEILFNETDAAMLAENYGEGFLSLD